jgi:hypothetical protein
MNECKIGYPGFSGVLEASEAANPGLIKDHPDVAVLPKEKSKEKSEEKSDWTSHHIYHIFASVVRS